MDVNVQNTPYQHNILVIEDDVMLGQLILDAIEQQYPVTWLQSGEHVIEQLSQQNFDLVILDLMLPKHDGYKLLHDIREIYPADELTIIIMSAISDADKIVQGFEAGANDYIVKPIEISVMMARITTHLNLAQLKAERHTYIKNLERGEEFRKQLNQIASHDLKGPLNNLRIAEGLLNEELADNEFVAQLLNTMSVSLDMMEQIVESFLDMVAIQTDSIQLNMMPVLMRDIIINAYAQYELAAQKKQISMELGSMNGVVMADAARMAQIAGNLVSNAIKYSPRGASIKTWTEIQEDGVLLCVADSGEGIPEEERHLLFTEFGKLSTRPTEGENSTGLGLWIVRHLIELQGGQAGADFPDEGGSIFWVKLPHAEDEDYYV